MVFLLAMVAVSYDILRLTACYLGYVRDYYQLSFSLTGYVFANARACRTLVTVQRAVDACVSQRTDSDAECWIIIEYSDQRTAISVSARTILSQTTIHSDSHASDCITVKCR